MSMVRNARMHLNFVLFFFDGISNSVLLRFISFTLTDRWIMWGFNYFLSTALGELGHRYIYLIDTCGPRVKVWCDSWVLLGFLFDDDQQEIMTEKNLSASAAWSRIHDCFLKWEKELELIWSTVLVVMQNENAFGHRAEFGSKMIWNCLGLRWCA